MDKFVVVQDNGLMQFVAGERKPWQLWKKPILLSPFNAATFDLHKSNEMRDKTQDMFKDHIVLSVNYNISQLGLVSDGGHLGQYKYFVVAGRSKYLHKTIYYTYDQEYFSKKRKRRMFKPVFDKDINKAEFIKSEKYAKEIVTRCRQCGIKMVTYMEVYIHKPNELLDKNIIVVLRHKENKKMRPQFLRSFDKRDGHFTKDKSHFHSTQKPVDLLRYLIRTYSNEGDLVLDNTAGSMSTAIAAIRENRRFVMIEKDTKYFEIGKKRIEEELSNPNMF